MRRVLVSTASVAVLLLSASVALANQGPPTLPKSVAEPSVALAAVAGGAGAVLAGWWFARRIKP